MPKIEPAYDDDERTRLIIDVRTKSERYSGMGFIPGSIGFTIGHDLSCAARLIDHMADSRLPVLVCLTGQQSRALALALAGVGTSSLGYLTGGVLGWGAIGMPLAGRGGFRASAPCIDQGELHHVLRAELEQLLDGVDIRCVDPVGLVLRRCALAMGCSLEQTTSSEQHTFLDWVAMILIELRVHHAKVTKLLDRMLAHLPSPRWNHIISPQLGALYEH